MALLAVTVVNRAGTILDGAAADVAGDTFPNTGSEFLFVKNGSGAGIVATLDVTATVDGVAVPDKTVNIAAGESRLIGPFPKGFYNDANGRVKVTCAPVASVLVKAL